MSLGFQTPLLFWLDKSSTRSRNIAIVCAPDLISSLLVIGQPVGFANNPVKFEEYEYIDLVLRCHLRAGTPVVRVALPSDGLLSVPAS